jgi:hypothetical protein
LVDSEKSPVSGKEPPILIGVIPGEGVVDPWPKAGDITKNMASEIRRAANNSFLILMPPSCQKVDDLCLDGFRIRKKCQNTRSHDLNRNGLAESYEFLFAN